MAEHFMDPRPAQVDLSHLLRRGKPAIDAAIVEDLGRGDPATQATLKPGIDGRAVIRAKAGGIIAGLPIVESVFRAIDPRVKLEPMVAEGAWVVPGEPIARVRGPLDSMLMAERTALNFLQRLSGIATLTARCVDAAATTDAVILDTRKTAPGLRMLDKYAVRIGGGCNHRLDLSAMAMLKDNHIDACGGIDRAAQAVQAMYPGLPMEIEVRNLEELDTCLSLSPLPDRILLDNETPDEMRDAVQRTARRVPLEASGGIDAERVAAVARSGVDSLSVGALTHSPIALDLSMTLDDDGESPDALAERVRDLRSRLSDRVAILAHHYVRDEVAGHADVVGDSLELARRGAELEAPFVVVCGVRFMGETAALLAQPNQRVILPAPAAGCYLADCIEPELLTRVWDALAGQDDVLPITYANSSAEIKAFCGDRGGVACTSANAAEVMRWALDRTKRVLFLPDQHLGRNAAQALGLSEDEIGILDPEALDGSAASRILLWPGACNVHRRFRWWDVERVRSQHPGIRVVVHPECSSDVVSLADDSGSTRHIIEQVEQDTETTSFALGTDARLVARLRAAHPDKTIVDLAEVPSMCATMAGVTVQRLHDVLQRIVDGTPPDPVEIEPANAASARATLDRMLHIGT